MEDFAKLHFIVPTLVILMNRKERLWYVLQFKAGLHFLHLFKNISSISVSPCQPAHIRHTFEMVPKAVFFRAGKPCYFSLFSKIKSIQTRWVNDSERGIPLLGWNELSSGN
jgi:hypothetical protein